jgi:membrane-bound ClpP family serine protease
MTYEALALLLMIVGFALIVAEVFIPSGGLLSILCVITFVASIWCAYKAWYGVHTGYFWAFITALLVLIPTAVAGAFRFLEQSQFGKRVLLTAPSQAEVVPHQGEVSRLTALIGQVGEALTLMKPGGMVLVQGERLHAESDGSLIAAASPIEVVGVKGTRVLVRERTAPPAAVDTGDDATTAAAPPARPPLDFDFPQG